MKNTYCNGHCWRYSKNETSYVQRYNRPCKEYHNPADKHWNRRDQHGTPTPKIIYHDTQENITKYRSYNQQWCNPGSLFLIESKLNIYIKLYVILYFTLLLLTTEIFSPIGELSLYSIGSIGDGQNSAIPPLALSKETKIIQI